MGVGFGSQRLKRSELEAWLGRVLVPVEPPEPFTARLRARLVELRGARPTSGWMTLLAALVLVLGAVVWLGTAVRLIAAGLTVLGLLMQRRRSSRSTVNR
jgi:hypothetical protein